MADLLTTVLAALRIRTTLFAIAELPVGWGVQFPPTTGAYFHVLTGTDGWLHLDGGEAYHVQPGETTLLAHGSAHRLTSRAGVAPLVLFDPVRWKPNQLNPSALGAAQVPDASLVCGAVDMHDIANQPLLRLMPDVFTVPDGDPGAAELELSLRLLRMETRRAGAGSQTMLARLGDVLLVQMIRRWLEQQSEHWTSWLGALRDPQLGAVVVAMHADPAAAWTLDSLAALARLSRSRFAERFAAQVGQAPLAYLTGVRLERSTALLNQGRSVREVGRAVGYQSEAAFSRAFTRRYGVPPSRFGR